MDHQVNQPSGLLSQLLGLSSCLMKCLFVLDNLYQTDLVKYEELLSKESENVFTNIFGALLELMKQVEDVDPGMLKHVKFNKLLNSVEKDLSSFVNYW